MRVANYFIVPFALDATIAAHMILVNLLAQDLGADAFQLGMMGSTWGIFYGVSCFFAGRSSHRLPRRATMTAGIWLFCLSVVSAQFARQPWHLYATAMLNGAGCALFWPLFETLLHHDDEATHAQRMTLFNLGWTTGLAFGSASGGMLKAAGAWLASAGFAPWQAWAPAGFSAAELGSPFGLACVALWAAGLGLYLPWATRRGLPALPSHEEAAAEAAAVREDNGRFLYLGWLANFAIWSASSVVYSLFPKLARELNATDVMHFPDRAIGFVLAIIVASQAIASRFVCRGGWWQYRVWPSCLMQVLGALGLSLIAFGASYAAFACAMILLGLGRAMTYVSSMHYGLADPVRRGRNMGVHETLIGAAVATGPFLGGAFARAVSLRATFVAAACWVGVALVVQAAVHAMAPRRAPS